MGHGCRSIKSRNRRTLKRHFCYFQMNQFDDANDDGVNADGVNDVGVNNDDDDEGEEERH